MKYEINLLPPGARTGRLQTIHDRREATFFWTIVVSGGIVLLSYGAIWWSLHSLQGSIADQLLSQNKDRTSVMERTKEVNKELGLLDARVGSYTLWTSRISDVLGVLPGGILVSRIELVEKPETLVVTGKASQGSEVVEYQAALEKLPWVDHVVAPLQNFARSPEATVTFTIFHKKPFPL